MYQLFAGNCVPADLRWHAASTSLYALLERSHPTVNADVAVSFADCPQDGGWPKEAFALEEEWPAARDVAGHAVACYRFAAA